MRERWMVLSPYYIMTSKTKEEDDKDNPTERIILHEVVEVNDMLDGVNYDIELVTIKDEF